MRRLLAWIDDRTDLRGIVHGALFEPIPGGARWRYVWGSTLVFTFVVQVLTGLVLWMFYSPGAQSAWESVYFLERHIAGGWLLRGIHHYTAQAMVVLLAIHLAQVVIDGAYKAPREFNFWIGLLLMLVVLGLALTGYLLPWDQKGYWATKVATRIASSAPVAGPDMERLAVGGNDYGHYTLTRFFALHAGVLPATMIVLIAIHVALFRKHGVTPHVSRKPRPDGFFWPEQVLRDAVACLVIFGIVLALSIYLQPELGAPADGADNYAAARPEWYFLFLFQFLKFFKGHTGEVIGAIVVPTLILGFMFLMPLIGRGRLGHAICIAAIVVLLCGAAGLTVSALYDDYQARWFSKRDYSDVTTVLDEIDIDLRKSGDNSKFARIDEEQKLQVFFKDAPDKLPPFTPGWPVIAPIRRRRNIWTRWPWLMKMPNGRSSWLPRAFRQQERYRCCATIPRHRVRGCSSSTARHATITAIPPATALSRRGRFSWARGTGHARLTRSSPMVPGPSPPVRPISTALAAASGSPDFSIPSGSPQPILTRRRCSLRMRLTLGTQHTGTARWSVW
jgi:quinol-cytochrome oxidoreductase complex cytochrome b subunit